MAKIHPQTLRPAASAISASSPSSTSITASSSSSSSKSVVPSKSSGSDAVFTIWLKSLILGGKGCTVFDSDGQVVYRVDNYNCQCSDRVYLMDSQGKILCTIYRKKFHLLSNWEGYKAQEDQVTEHQADSTRRWFQVRKTWTMFKKPSVRKVIVSLDHDTQPHVFTMVSTKNKKDSSCKIVDGSSGVLVAEMRRKQSVHGITLGNDVRTLSIEPNTDPSLVMGLVVVHSLIGSRM